MSMSISGEHLIARELGVQPSDVECYEQPNGDIEIHIVADGVKLIGVWDRSTLGQTDFTRFVDGLRLHWEKRHELHG